MPDKIDNPGHHGGGRPARPFPQIRTTIGLDEPIRTTLERIAMKNDRSLSAEINYRLRKSIEEEVL